MSDWNVKMKYFSQKMIFHNKVIFPHYLYFHNISEKLDKFQPRPQPLFWHFQKPGPGLAGAGAPVGL